MLGATKLLPESAERWALLHAEQSCDNNKKCRALRHQRRAPGALAARPICYERGDVPDCARSRPCYVHKSVRPQRKGDDCRGCASWNDVFDP